MEEMKQPLTLPEFVMPRLTLRAFHDLENRVRRNPLADDPMYQAMCAVIGTIIPDYETRLHVPSRQSPLLYFIQVGDAGPVKIGISGNPEKRLAQLQTAQPERLRLLLAFPGGREIETFLHKKLDPLCLGGEWFAFHQVIHDLVTAYRRAFYGAYGETCYV